MNHSPLLPPAAPRTPCALNLGAYARHVQNAECCRREAASAPVESLRRVKRERMRFWARLALVNNPRGGSLRAMLKV